MKSEKNLLRGVLAGAAGGLAASWMMNEFLSGPGVKLQHAFQGEAENRQEQAHSGETKEDATMKAADAIVSTATGGRHLTWEQKQKAGPIMHYVFGALMGGMYGGLAEYSSTITSGFGTTFGGILFGGADVFAVPTPNLSPPLDGQATSELVSPFGAHVVFGVTTELVRRIVRAVL
jgi:putative membrane protein